MKAKFFLSVAILLATACLFAACNKNTPGSTDTSGDLSESETQAEITVDDKVTSPETNGETDAAADADTNTDTTKVVTASQSQTTGKQSSAQTTKAPATGSPTTKAPAVTTSKPKTTTAQTTKVTPQTTKAPVASNKVNPDKLPNIVTAVMKVATFPSKFVYMSEDLENLYYPEMYCTLTGDYEGVYQDYLKGYAITEHITNDAQTFALIVFNDNTPSSVYDGIKNLIAAKDGYVDGLLSDARKYNPDQEGIIEKCTFTKYDNALLFVIYDTSGNKSIINAVNAARQ